LSSSEAMISLSSFLDKQSIESGYWPVVFALYSTTFLMDAANFGKLVSGWAFL